MAALRSLYLKIASPIIVVTPVSAWAYYKRKSNLQHPVMQRAIAHIGQDQRIIDFCGDQVSPGYWISVNQSETDNYIKFGFKVKGTSGELKASVIADYLTHRELSILETERQDYFGQRQTLLQKIEDIKKAMWRKDATKEEEMQNKKKDLDSHYIPIDFDSYSITDLEIKSKENSLTLGEEDKIWRISSLTMFIDSDTKILLLPQPESKRTVKIRDTKYEFATVGDLIKQSEHINTELKKDEYEENQKRYEDKTKAEINQEMIKKRQQRMNQMIQMRKYQFVGFTIIGFFYFFVYRIYLNPKPIYNSVLYHNSLKLIKNNMQVQRALGDHLQIMNCNGKTYPLLMNCQFNVIVFGNEAKGRIDVRAEYQRDNNAWKINQMDLVTLDNKGMTLMN